VFFVPSLGIDDFTGGTVSLGDTIDFGALVAWYLAELSSAAAPRVPPHPSRLSASV
jgi:hypothetical protein